MVLHFITKVLFIVEPNKHYIKSDIINFISEVAKTRLSHDELKSIINNKIKIKEDAPNGRIIEGMLFFKNATTRNIYTKLPAPLFEKQLLNSIIAILYSCNNKLDEFNKEYLKDALVYLADAYNSKNIDPSSMRSMIQLPNEAFMARFLE